MKLQIIVPTLLVLGLANAVNAAASSSFDEEQVERGQLRALAKGGEKGPPSGKGPAEWAQACKDLDEDTCLQTDAGKDGEDGRCQWCCEDDSSDGNSTGTCVSPDDHCGSC